MQAKSFGNSESHCTSSTVVTVQQLRSLTIHTTTTTYIHVHVCCYTTYHSISVAFGIGAEEYPNMGICTCTVAMQTV